MPNHQKFSVLKEKGFSIAVCFAKRPRAGRAVDNQNAHYRQVKDDPPDLPVAFQVRAEQIRNRKHKLYWITIESGDDYSISELRNGRAELVAPVDVIPK